MSEKPDGRATPLEYQLENMGAELKAYVTGLRQKVRELESRQILHLSLRLAGITGRTSWGGEGPKPLPDHLGIAIYFIFGAPENDAKLLGYEKRYDPQEFGLAFGLSPEKYEALMKTGSNEVVIHEVNPENSQLKNGEQFPIEFLTESEVKTTPPVRGT